MDDIHINAVEDLGDEFYEDIQAPKFVDLTDPGHYLPETDDRYWFCLRVGCDQKHEEELDSEQIYKNFVLRVMAARSPNVRLRKGLCKKDPSTNLKCPLTVPAKPSKSRISRLAMISSISQKMADGKAKSRPLPKLSSATPKGKQSSVAAAKSLTTPQNKKRLSNPGTFRSVRNPKPTSVMMPKSRVVAKSLVFHSPKKTVKIKTSAELGTRMKAICAGMKKLEITGGRKHESDFNKSLPSVASRKQFRGREVKSRVYDSLRSKNLHGKEVKTPKCLKKKNKQTDIQQSFGPAPVEGIEKDDSSDMEIEEKSRYGSLDVCSTLDSSKCNERTEHDKECLVPLNENKGEDLSDTSRSNMTSLSNCEENAGECDNEEKARVMNGDDTEHDKECLVFLNENKGENLSDTSRSNMTSLSNCEEKNAGECDNEEKAKVMNGDDKENAVKEDECKVMGSNDKENVSSADDNRKLNPNTRQMVKKKILGKHETCKSIQTTSKGMCKASKGNSASAATTEGVNYRKPKLTNPKPFRLRTDERRILKEANLEKKLHPVESLKEITTERVPGGSSQRKLKKATHRIEQVEYAHDGSEKQSDKTKQKDEPPRMETSCTRKQPMHQKTNRATSQQELGQDKAAKRSEKTLRRTKSLCMKQSTITRGTESSKKKTISVMTPGRLHVIKESSPTILRTNIVPKPSESGASPATRISAAAASSRSSSAARRRATVPKEPHFHDVHMPKSCTRRVT